MRLPSLALASAILSLLPTSLGLAVDVPSPSAAVDPAPAPSSPPDEPDERNKYFHEPGGDDRLGHYDVRFFKGIVPDQDREDTLHHMIRAYLLMFRDKGLETWIAHGTLLGWWWNGKILPWDWDLDVQVSGPTLEYMASHLNRTTHRYISPTDRSVRRHYLLDVNPYARERVRGDGMNVIDARWIDVRNGLFIDITGLSETEPEEHPGVWICKNLHRYDVRDLYPLRQSIFEGVPVGIPYAYDRILSEEYETKALVVTEYEGHHWSSQSKEWIRLDGEKLKEQKGSGTPHIPRDLQPRSVEPGLGNIWRLLGGS
ncbi:MAG: hypothetical protein M1817_003663 [Caeruleum heppii]|nr:MAG: hypothetical protein M1817_003663 [Caeruleum heppii]